MPPPPSLYAVTRAATDPASARRRRSTALLVVLALLPALLGLAGPGVATAASDPGDPLSVTIDAVSPAAIPRRGPVVVSGVVSNPTDKPWTDVRAYPLTSAHPLTDPASLAAALATPGETDLGSRLLTVGEKLGDLPPGASVRYQLRIPRATLQIDGQPGVYWLGVQVLGANQDGRDQLADGRARTLLPLVGRRASPVPVSLIVPVRQAVPRGGDGTLKKAAALAQQLSPDGRLGHLLAWAQRAPSGSLTWLLDPAVVQGAADVASGNPDLGVHRATPGGPSSSPTPSPTPSPTASPTASATRSSAAGPAPLALTDEDEQNARSWLTGLTDSARRQTVLALPYADPDVSTLAKRDPSLLAAGSTLSRGVLTDEHITSTPAVAPPSGYLRPGALPALPRPAVVLLTDHADTSAGSDSGTGADRHALVAGSAEVSDGRTLVVTSSGLTDPPRDSPATALQLRQRLVADAALHTLDGSSQPLLVQLPTRLDPGTDTGASFFGALQALPWLALSPLPTGSPAAGDVAASLPWPRRARREAVPLLNVATAAQLHRSGTALAQLLADDGTRVDRLVTGSALSVVSVHARPTPRAARAAAQPLLARVHQLLGLISVLGTNFVTLSGDAGYLTVAVVNGLDAPVTVGLAALPGARGVRIDLPSPTRLAAGQRSTLRLQAHSSVPGVHVVRLVPVTSEGLQVGAPLVFNLRTSQVGQFFWAVLALLGIALVVLVGRRIRQRLREDRRGW